MVSEFLTGLSAVLALVAVGGFLLLILMGFSKQFPFTRLALVLALTPITLVRFLDGEGNSTLYLYSMIVSLVGITIDGINYLLLPKPAPKPEESAVERKPAAGKAESNVIVWEKAE